MSETHTEEKSNIHINTNKIDSNENLLLPESIPTVHADKVTIAVDYSGQTVTMTLLTMHPIPKLSGKIDVDNYAFELKGEVKIPFAEMDLLATYYLTTRTSNRDTLLDFIIKHLKTYPNNKAENDGSIVFGPTGIK